MPTSSGSDELTPGTSVASCTKLRLLSGSSWTWVEPIRFCTAGVVWIRRLGGDLDRRLHPRQLERGVQVRRSLTWSTIPFVVLVWKPDSAKVSS